MRVFMFLSKLRNIPKKIKFRGSPQGWRGLRRETPKVAPGAAERDHRGSRSRRGDKPRPEGLGCWKAQAPRPSAGRPQGCRSSEAKRRKAVRGVAEQDKGRPRRRHTEAEGLWSRVGKQEAPAPRLRAAPEAQNPTNICYLESKPGCRNLILVF